MASKIASIVWKFFLIVILILASNVHARRFNNPIPYIHGMKYEKAEDNKMAPPPPPPKGPREDAPWNGNF